MNSLLRAILVGLFAGVTALAAHAQEFFGFTEQTSKSDEPASV